MDRILRLSAASHTKKGANNAENQDRILLDPQLGVFVAADGLGGHKGGALASSVAVNTIWRILRPQMRFSCTASLGSLVRESIGAANRAIRELSRTRKGVEDMATTVVVAVLRGTDGLIANVGDTRAYKLTNGRLSMVSQDHSAAAELVSVRLLSGDQSRKHPFRNIVTRAVGSADTVSPHFARLVASDFDMLLFCTDGLWGFLPDKLIEQELLRNGTLHQKCSRLVNRAAERGSGDDITCGLVAPLSL